MHPTRIFLAMLVGLAALGAQDDPQWVMRSRVFCDAKAGVSFSYPYAMFPIDQYKGDLRRERTLETSYEKIEATDDKGVKHILLVPKASKDKDDAPDIHEFSFGPTELTEFGNDPKLSAIGDREAKAELGWKDFEYYGASPTRPFADPKWADDGFVAIIGEADARCALVIKHGERISGLVLKGKLDSDNRKILESFEILSTGKKLKKGDKPEKKARLIDWREFHCRTGKVVDPSGKLSAPGLKNEPVAWKNSWEIETEHYHVTTDFSPQRLLQHGQYVEALFRAYSKVYEPDALPPYKFEVHIFNTYREFQTASAAHDNAIPSGPNSIVGGFFVPSLLSLWVYEESGAIGGPEFSVEHVMAHECSHQFLHVTCNGSDHIPTWINEGLAVYFESGVFQGGEFQIRSPTGRINELKRDYEQLKSTLSPLDQYLDHHGFISAAAYGEVFAMTSFWVFGTCSPDPTMCKHKSCGLKRFREYFTALRHGEDGAKAFERIFMDDMIKAQGTREKAVDLWQKALMEYVANKLK